MSKALNSHIPLTHFQIIVEQSPVSTQLFSPNGTTILVNKAWEKMWGANREDVIGKYNILKDKQLIVTGIMPFIRKAFNGSVAHTHTIRYEPNRTIPDIKTVMYRYVKAVVYPIKDDKGKVIQIVLQHDDVTEQTEAELKLLESEQRLKAVWEVSSDAMALSDEQGIVIAVNPAYSKLYGFKEKEVVGKLFTIIFPKNYHKQALQTYKSIFVKGVGGVVPESNIVTKKGENKIVESVYEFITYGGNKKALLSILRDITDQKKREREQSHLASIIATSDDAIITKDLNGIIQTWNTAAERMFGYSSNEAIGKNITLIIPKELRSEEDEIIGKIRRGIPISHFETTRVGKHGKRIMISLSVSPMKNAKGEIIGASKIARDITESKLAEIKLRENENRLRLAVGAGNIGVWDWYIQTNTLIWSDEVYEFFDTSRDEFTVTFDSFRKRIHPDDAKKTSAVLQYALKHKKEFDLTFRILSFQGVTKWITTRATVIKDANNKPFRVLGMTIDVTRQKEMDQEKRDFLSMASHELKTPLTSMKMFIELLHKHISDIPSEKANYFVKRITDQANRLNELTNDLLDVSRIETGKLRLNKTKFSLNSLIAEAVEGIQPSTPKHKLQIIDGEKITVKADKYRIYQVLVNLLTNAVKYSPIGKEIRISSVVNGESVLVSVQDFGIGIRREQQDKIFNRLYQATTPKEKTYPGLGLGLYIAKEIVNRHKGDMWVDSKVGKGSTFTFSLPLSSKK